MYLNLSQKLAVLFAWVLLIVILLLSPMPEANTGEQTTFIDKIIHAILFGVMAFLVFFTINTRDEKLVFNPDKSVETTVETPKKYYVKFNRLLGMFLIAFSTSIGLSIILEYAQLYVPGRSPNDYDLLSSVTGVVLTLLYLYGSNYSKKNK